MQQTNCTPSLRLFDQVTGQRGGECLHTTTCNGVQTDSGNKDSYLITWSFFPATCLNKSV
jgi:hypothetical protein